MLKQTLNRILFSLLLSTSFISAQTDLIDEDFSGTTLPAGWSNTNNGGTAGQIWEFTPTSNGTITAGNFSGNYAVLDSDAYGTGNNQDATLATPTFSTGIYETITLEFDYQYREYDGVESCVVEVYDGTTWTEVFRLEIGDENYVSLSSGSNFESIDITTEAGGSSAAQVRFTYIGEYDWWWAIDNVIVTGTEPSTTNSYLGPGGVGNTDGTSDLRFWYDANNESYSNGASVNSVTDKSGYTNSLTASGTEQPTYTLSTTGANSMSSFSFDGGDELETTYNGNSNENMSFFMTLNYTSAAELDVALQHGGRNTIGFSATDYFTDFVGGSNHTSTTTASGSWEIHSKTFANTGTNRLKFYVNNSNTDNFTHTIQNRTSNTWIGGNGTGGGTKFAGSIAEIIKYTKTINNAERIIVDNYLAAKYNITLSSNDFYNEDTSGENFDFNVAGIGRASDGSLHLDSQGTGIIRINTPSDINNDEFLFWGEDVKNANYDFSSSASADYVERLDTKWRVSKRNDLGTVTVSVEASDLTLNSADGCNDLKLIVSSSSTFATKTTYDLVLSSGTYTATAVSFSDNDYFTIEYVDTIVLDATTAYNGTGISNVPSTSDDCYKLLIKSTADGTPSLSENADVREVEVESGGKLVTDSGIRLQVENGIQLDGDIRLVGTSQLIQNHNGTSQITGSGSLYVDQNSDLTSVYRYNYWSSPVKEIGASNYTVEGVMKDGTTVTSATSIPTDLTFTTDYDGSTGPLVLSSYWIYGYLNGDDSATWSQKFESGTFNPGEGYLLKSPGAAQNYTFKGTPNDGNFSFTVDADKTSLLGNPYPSALDANQLFTDSSNLATIYFWEHKNEVSTSGDEGHYKSGYIGGYSYRNATMGTAADTDLDGIAGLGGETYTAPGQYIPIGQGFFVETATGLSATINFNNAQREFITEAGDSHFFKENSKKKKRKTTNYSILKFGFEAQNSEGIYIHSQIGISFSKGKTFATDIGFDSKKNEIKESDMYFQFEGFEDKLVIAGVEEISEDLLVPLTLTINTSEDVFILLDEKLNIDRTVYIHDAVEKTYHDISKPLKLNLDNKVYSNRFFIAFKNHSIEEEEILPKDLIIYQNNTTKQLKISNFKNLDVKSITLFSLIGKKIIEIPKEEILNKNEFIIRTDKIATSIYFIKIDTFHGLISKKIVIK